MPTYKWDNGTSFTFTDDEVEYYVTERTPLVVGPMEYTPTEHGVFADFWYSYIVLPWGSR